MRAEAFGLSFANRSGSSRETRAKTGTQLSDAHRSLVVFGLLDLLTQSVKFLAQRL
jgi:hypothetical protein